MTRVAVGIACVLVIGTLLIFAVEGHSVAAPALEDESPLPAGAVVVPESSSLDSASNLRAIVRISIDSFGRFIKRMSVPIGNGKCVVTDLSLSQHDATRMAIDTFRAAYSGEFDVEVASITFPVTAATVNLAGTTLRPHVDKDWVLQTDPDLRLRLEKLEVSSWLAPDAAFRVGANTIFNRTIRSEIIKHMELPLRDLIDPLWDRANVDIGLAEWDAPCKGTVSLRPTGAYVIQPVVDDVEKSIRLGLGVDFSSVLFVGDTPGGAHLARAPLPTLKELSTADRSRSRIRLPIVVRVDELASFWRPMLVPVSGGEFRIEAVELTESEGLIHGRMHFVLDRETGDVGLLPKQLKGVVRFRFRPTCDPSAGQLGISEFAFTEKSNAILVDLIGKAANGLIRSTFEEAVPRIAGDLFRQAEFAAREHVNEVLTDAIAHWSSQVPKFGDDLKHVVPDVAGIVFLPKSVTVKDGHLVVILDAEATVSVAIDDSALVGGKEEAKQ